MNITSQELSDYRTETQKLLQHIEKIYFNVSPKVGDLVKERNVSFERSIKKYMAAQCTFRTPHENRSNFGEPRILSLAEKTNASLDAMNAMRDVRIFIQEKCQVLIQAKGKWDEKLKVLNKFLSGSFPRELTGIGMNTVEKAYLSKILIGLGDHIVQEVAYALKDEMDQVVELDFYLLFSNFSSYHGGQPAHMERMYQKKEMHVVYHLIKSNFASAEFAGIIERLRKAYEKNQYSTFSLPLHEFHPSEIQTIKKAFAYLDAGFLIMRADIVDFGITEMVQKFGLEEEAPIDTNNRAFMEYFLKEWHEINEGVVLEDIPEFMYSLNLEEQSSYAMEVLTQTSPESNNQRNMFNLKYFPIPLVEGALRDKVMTSQYGQRGFGVMSEEIIFPLFQNILTGGIVGSGSTGLEDYPRMDILSLAERIPGGSALIQKILLKYLDQFKNAITNYQSSPIVESSEEEVLNEDQDLSNEVEMDSIREYPEDILQDIHLEDEQKQNDCSVLQPEDIIRDDRQSYIVTKLASEQLPVIAVVEMMSKYPNVQLSTGCTLVKAPQYVKHIGWRDVHRIIKKYFACTTEHRNSSHMDVKRIVDGKEYNGTILSPYRNKYSKNAAFGTIRSVLRQLDINEYDFWEAVKGTYTPEKVINLTQQHYEKKVNGL